MTTKKTPDERTREIDAQGIARENGFKAAAWDETRKEVADLTVAVRGLKAAFDSRALIVFLSIMVGVLTVIVALAIYYILFTGPTIDRVNELERLVHQQQPAASSTTTTTPFTPNSPTTTTPVTRTNPPQSPQSPSNGPGGVGTPGTSTTTAPNSPTTTTTRPAPSPPTTTCITTPVLNVCR